MIAKMPNPSTERGAQGAWPDHEGDAGMNDGPDAYLQRIGFAHSHAALVLIDARAQDPTLGGRAEIACYMARQAREAADDAAESMRAACRVLKASAHEMTAAVRRMERSGMPRRPVV